MRIAVCSDNFAPELGGIQDAIEVLAVALASRGHQIDIYAPWYSPRDYRFWQRNDNRTEVEFSLGNNIRVHRLASLPFPSPTKQSRFVPPAPPLRFSHTPDIIHCHTFFGVGLRGLAAAQQLGIPIVGSNHTAIAAFSAYIPLPMIFVFRYIIWYFNRCDLVCAPSASVFSELGATRIRRPLIVVPNPIDTHCFLPASAGQRSALKAKFNLSEHAIIYAGRLGREKNVDKIIAAIAELKDAAPSLTLAIAGHGSDERRLRAMSAQLGVGQRVRFLGTLDKRSLAQLFCASELFVTMSTSETQCMALMQAMACGLPAVVADARALPEFVSERTGVLVKDLNHLCQGVMGFLQDNGRRLSLGTNASAYARRFSPETSAGYWERCYEELVRRTKGDGNDTSSNG